MDETEFSIILGYVGRIKLRYLNVLSANKIFDLINILSAPNKVGIKQAHKNVKTFNDFKYFFQTTKEASRCYFLTEIGKFFDPDTRSLTINTILDYSEKHLTELTKDNFLEHHKGRVIIPELFTSYKALSPLDIKQFRKRINNKQEIIGRLLIYRNKYLAHDDVKKNEVFFGTKDFKQVLKLVEDFIKLFYLKLDFSSNDYKNYIEEPDKEIKRLVSYLQKYEVIRVREIEKRFNISLKR